MTWRSSLWRQFSVVYMLLSLYLIALHPSYFQGETGSAHWPQSYSMTDLCTSGLFLLPLGMLLRQAFKLPYWLVLPCGIGVGLFLAPGPLSMPSEMVVRHVSMNSVARLPMTATTGPDGTLEYLVSGAVGGVFGAILYDMTSSPKHPMANMTLAYMLIPLIWIASTHVLGSPIFILLVLPIAIASLLLVHAETPSWIPRSVVFPIWILITLGPLLYTQWIMGVVLLSLTVLSVYVIAMDISSPSALEASVSLMSIEFMILITVIFLEGFQMNVFSWHQLLDSHWLEFLLLGTCIAVARTWQRNDLRRIANDNSMRPPIHPNHILFLRGQKRKFHQFIRKMTKPHRKKKRRYYQ
ncbi:MAG: hypothetical protein F6K16_41430 [Symploca sp. SIO2B6]|nr:hypothetical protein [Symploca sp. SIO2B6]